MPKTQKIGVNAFIYKGEKVLVFKRVKTEKLFPDAWEIPGGGVKYGENAEDALKREIKEEVGIDIKILKPYSTFSYIYSKIHRIDIQYLCRPLSKNIKISKEHSAFFWASKRDIKKLETTEKMRAAILKGFDFIK